MKLLEFLGGAREGDGSFRFALGGELHGAFGGANGGVLGAVCVATARSLAPGREPAALDVHFIRGLRAGVARAVPTLLHAGRTLAWVSLDVFDERGGLCTRATISLVEPAALHPLDAEGEAGVPQGWVSHDDGKPWARPAFGVRVPLIETFDPRVVGRDERGIATSTRVLWDEPGTCAEAACIAADISVGPPVGGATSGRAIPIPNPDLSLRFNARAELPRTLVSAARLERIQSGLALTRIEVRAGDALVATGVSCTTLLAGSWPDASRGSGSS